MSGQENPPAASPSRSGVPLLSPTGFRRFAILSLVLVALIVISGAAVRLTGSGLGCSDWPSCSYGSLTPPVQFHSLIEFGNRMITVLITVVVAVTFVAAFRRRPFRRDLVWLSAGLVFGILAEAGMGGIVVYTKLNPYVVAAHFLLALPIVVNAVVLLHRCSRDYGPTSEPRLLVRRPFVLLARGNAGLLGIVFTAGAFTTGAGPHAGSGTSGIARRIPVALRSVAELHSTLALLLIGATWSLVIALHAVDVPERVRRAGRFLIITLMAQAAVGYTQYFTRLPAALVEVHVTGAVILVIGMTQFLLSLTFRAAEPGPEPTTSDIKAETSPLDAENPNESDKQSTGDEALPVPAASLTGDPITADW